MKICKNCGYYGEEKIRTRGNLGLEIVFWLITLFGIWLMLFVALPYTIWRRAGKFDPFCPKCGAKNMIPVDTPVGKQLADEHGLDYEKLLAIQRYEEEDWDD